jgi:hypothetical protein
MMIAKLNGKHSTDADWKKVVQLLLVEARNILKCCYGKGDHE